MSYFNDLNKAIVGGMGGDNAGIPMGFPRLNYHVNIRKSMTYLIGGFTGGGKTTFVDDAFVLNPIEWILSSHNADNMDMEIVYWSMERKKTFKLAKWISRRIFLNTGQVIPIQRMMGWVSKKDRLTLDEHDLVMLCEEYIDALETKVHIIEGPQNPTGIRKYMDELALKNGRIDKIDKYHSTYTPHNEKKIVISLKDSAGLQKFETGLATKKAVIDKGSEDERKFRDFYGMSNVDISQFNRDISSPVRIKNGDVEPMLEDFKETGNTQEDADVVFALFDPMRYKVPDPSGYNLDKLRDSSGVKYYRSLKILKNTYGSDDIRIGLAMQPVVGHFKEMPKKQDITDYDYDCIVNNQYFL